MSFNYMTDKSKHEMEFLVTTEGILFQDENVKKFYLIVKYFILDIFENVWNIYNENINEYKNIIDAHGNVSDATQILKKFPDLNDDLKKIIILYTKFIYKNDIIKIKKPDIHIFMKGFVKKFINIKQVQNGLFYNLNLIEQDFILRDLFRQTLFMDCLQVVDRKEGNSGGSGASVAPSFVPTIISPPPKVNLQPSVVPSIAPSVHSIPSAKEIEEPLIQTQAPLQTISEPILEVIQVEPKTLEPQPNLEPLEKLNVPLLPEVPLEECKDMEFDLSDGEDITEDDSISRVMEKMYLNTLQNQPLNKKKIKKIILTT